MDPHAAAVYQVLTVCQANAQERQVFIACERLNRLDDFAQMSVKEITELASKFERRTVADGRIVIPAKVIKNIQVLCFSARERERAGQPLLAGDYTAAALAEAKETMRLRDEAQQEAPSIKPDKFSPNQWTEYFTTYFSHTKGVQYAPLDYVIRTKPPPTAPANMNQRERALYQFPSNGRHFVDDNNTVAGHGRRTQ